MSCRCGHSKRLSLCVCSSRCGTHNGCLLCYETPCSSLKEEANPSGALRQLPLKREPLLRNRIALSCGKNKPARANFARAGVLYTLRIKTFCYLLISKSWFMRFFIDSTSSVMLKSPCMVCFITELATAKFTMSSGFIPSIIA